MPSVIVFLTVVAQTAFLFQAIQIDKSHAWTIEKPTVMPQKQSSFVMKEIFDTKESNVVPKVSERHGMPWKTSLEDGLDECIYMPFWEWQMDYFRQHLTNFKVTTLEDSSLEYLVSKNNTHRMVTMVGCSDEYRYIRMTYMDGGSKSQIFTSVCYPRKNLPILGVDLLQFAGGKRHLAIVDLQPIHGSNTHVSHDAEYEHLLKPIRDAAPSLQESMTDRFFSPEKYFSKQTLIGRFQTSPECIWEELWPAFQGYVKTNVDLIQKTTQSPKRISAKEVIQRHAEYDTYVSARDPAHPMFAALFGNAVAEKFMHDVLFPLAPNIVKNT